MSPSVHQPHTQFPDSFKFSKFEMDVVPWFSVAASDRNWQVMKFPDIGFFAGTTLEKSVEAWWIPKVPVLYNTVTGIAGCANCKLQSVSSVSGVSVICIHPLHISDTSF